MYVVRAMEGLARACSLSATQLFAEEPGYLLHSTCMMHKRAMRPIIKCTCPSCPKPPAAADFLHINMTLATIGIKQTLVASSTILLVSSGRMVCFWHSGWRETSPRLSHVHLGVDGARPEWAFPGRKTPQ